MDLTTVASIATIIAAAIALGGVAIKLMKPVVGRRSSRPDVRVKLSGGFIPSYPAIPILILTATNHGNKVVVLNSVGFTLPNKHSLFFPKQPGPVILPHDLEPGRNCQVHFPMSAIASSLRASGYDGIVMLRGFYKDELDNRYVSKPTKFTIGRWAT